MKKVWSSTTVFMIATGLATVALGAIVYQVFPALVWILLFLCWASYRLRLMAVARFGNNAADARSSSASSSYWPDDEDETAGAGESEA